MVKSAGSYAQGQRAPQFEHHEVRALAHHFAGELDALIRRLNAPSEARFRVLNRAPSRPEPGMVVYADGTKWDPGSGEGLYVYTSTGWLPVATSGANTETLVALTEKVVEANLAIQASLEQLVMITAGYSGIHVAKEELPDHGLSRLEN